MLLQSLRSPAQCIIAASNDAKRGCFASLSRHQCRFMVVCYCCVVILCLNGHCQSLQLFSAWFGWVPSLSFIKLLFLVILFSPNGLFCLFIVVSFCFLSYAVSFWLLCVLSLVIVHLCGGVVSLCLCLKLWGPPNLFLHPGPGASV